MSCKLSQYAFARRLKLATYIGPLTGSTGGTLFFAYAVGDPVPLGLWRIIYRASIINAAQGYDVNPPTMVGNTQGGLFIAPPSFNLSSKLNNGYNDLPCFYSADALSARNLPPAVGIIRIDDLIGLGDTGQGSTLPAIPNETTCIKHPVMVPEGWCPLAYAGVNNQPSGTTSTSIGFRMLYADLSQNEEVDLAL